MNIRRGIILTVCLIALYLLLPRVLYAWTGYDYDTGDYIEIDGDVSTIQGKDIDIYDYSDDSYHDVYVMSVNRNGDVIIEVFDYDTGDYRTFEIDMNTDDQQKDREST